MKARILLAGFRVEDYLSLPDFMRGNDLQAELAQVEANEIMPLLGQALFEKMVEKVLNPPLRGKWAELYRLLAFYMAQLAVKNSIVIFQKDGKSLDNQAVIIRVLTQKVQKSEHTIKRFLHAEKQEFSNWQPQAFDGGILNL